MSLNPIEHKYQSRFIVDESTLYEAREGNMKTD